MPNITWTHRSLRSILDAIPDEVKSIVDIGCGRGIMGALARIYREPNYIVGIDAHLPYLNFCSDYDFYDKLIQWDLMEFPLPLENKEFEIATCIEVIEHLSKNEGYKLLDELDRIAHNVILTTPNIFFSQESYDDNPFQIHKSSWSVMDFRTKGYQVYGIGALKVFGYSIKSITFQINRFTKLIPGISSTLLCIK